MNISRDDLKYNFLRRIIIRLDYNGIIDIKDSIQDLQDIIYKYGFVEMNSEYINEVEFELNDPIIIENQNMVSLKELNRTETYKFRNIDRTIELEVNKLFMTITINTKEYHEFESYRDIFIEVAEIIKSKNKYLKPIRIGLRKINNCIIRDKSKFKHYFNSKYFNNIADSFKEDGVNVDVLVGNYSDTIYEDRYFFNYIRNISDATLNLNNKKSNVYQVALDIDGYSNDDEWLKEVVLNKERFKLTLDEINGLLFTLYTKTLTNNFINRLVIDDMEWNDILGVKKNGDI